MKQEQWDQYKDRDGSIDVVALLRDQEETAGIDLHRPVAFLQRVTRLRPIYSRQTAALAVSMAIEIGLAEEREK